MKCLKSILCFLICIHCSLPTFGQKEMQPNVSKYYYWTNQAELAVNSENWTMAISCYDSAFKYKKPFSTDLRAAYIISNFYLNDTCRMIKYIHEFLRCDEEKYFASSYLSRKDCDTNFYLKIKTVEDTTKSTCIPLLQEQLEQILKLDQSFSHALAMTSKEKKIDRTNRKAIRKLYKTYPQINEYTAGLYYIRKITVPCLHFVQLGHNQLQPLLLKQVLLGNYPARFFMDLENNKTKNSKDFGHFSFEIIHNTLFYTSPSDIGIINKNRKELGIYETYEEYVSKVITQFKSRKLRTIMINQLSYGDDDQDYSEAEQLKKEIDEEHKAGDFSRMYYEKQ